MKYESPKIEFTEFEVKDIITASNGNYDVEDYGNGEGEVIFDASGLFSKFKK